MLINHSILNIGNDSRSITKSKLYTEQLVEDGELKPSLKESA